MLEGSDAFNLGGVQARTNSRAWSFGWIVAGLASVLALGLAAALFWAQGAVERRLRDAAGARGFAVEIEGVSVWPGEVSIGELRLRYFESGGLVATAGSVDVGVALWPGMHPGVEAISRVDIGQLRVDAQIPFEA
mgnify:CR=1 FL=1